MTILSMLRVIERNGIFPPEILSPSLKSRRPRHFHFHVPSRGREKNRPTILLPFFLFSTPAAPTYCRNSAAARGRGAETGPRSVAVGQSNQSRASSAEGRAEFEGDESRERDRVGRSSPSFAAFAEDFVARSLEVLRSRSRRPVTSRRGCREPRVDSGVGAGACRKENGQDRYASRP